VLLFLSSLPLWLSAFFTVLLPTGLAMLGPFLVRKRCTLSVLVKNNEIAGFKFATVGVIYAVLLAFAIVAVWDKFTETELLVMKEAGASATIGRIAAGDTPEAVDTRAALRGYLNAVVEEEWPSMAKGEESFEVRHKLDALYRAAMRLVDNRPQGIGVEIMQELGAITEARRSRLHHSMGAVPTPLWVMLTVGAVITVGFTFFFGMENLRAQSLMTGALAVIIFLGLFVIVAYDHPFLGEVSISPEALTVLDEPHRP
jgi:Protein of unknown function (DUF4239)